MHIKVSQYAGKPLWLRSIPNCRPFEWVHPTNETPPFSPLSLTGILMELCGSIAVIQPTGPIVYGTNKPGLRGSMPYSMIFNHASVPDSEFRQMRSYVASATTLAALRMSILLARACRLPPPPHTLSHQLASEVTNLLCAGVAKVAPSKGSCPKWAVS
jgi:hypothetical protein